MRCTFQFVDGESCKELAEIGTYCEHHANLIDEARRGLIDSDDPPESRETFRQQRLAILMAQVPNS